MGMKTFDQCRLDFMEAFEQLEEARSQVRHQHAPRLSALISAEKNFKSAAEDLARVTRATQTGWSEAALDA